MSSILFFWLITNHYHFERESAPSIFIQILRLLVCLFLFFCAGVLDESSIPGVINESTLRTSEDL